MRVSGIPADFANESAQELHQWGIVFAAAPDHTASWKRECHDTLAKRGGAIMVPMTLLLLAISGLPIPDDKACESAEALIQEVYGEQIEAARSPEQKANLAREILDVAKEEPDPANKYVGLQTARKLATEALDGELALEAVQAQVAAFDGDVDGERALRRAEMLWDAAENKRGREQLERRLEAVEYWLRAESESKLLQKKWQARIEEIKGGGEIVLRAKDATLVGTRIVYDPRTDLTLHWKSPNEYMEWRTTIPSGKYNIAIEYSADAQMGWGSILGLSLFAPNASRPLAASQGTFRPTGQWGNTTIVRFPPIRVPNSSMYVVRLHVLRHRQQARNRGIISLRQVRLVPK